MLGANLACPSIWDSMFLSLLPMGPQGRMKHCGVVAWPQMEEQAGGQASLCDPEPVALTGPWQAGEGGWRMISKLPASHGLSLLCQMGILQTGTVLSLERAPRGKYWDGIFSENLGIFRLR